MAKVKLIAGDDLKQVETEVNKAIKDIPDDKLDIRFSHSVSEIEKSDFTTKTTAHYGVALIIRS